MRTLYIPIDMCIHVLKNGFYTAFQLFIYLKINCHGQMKISDNLLPKIATDLDIKSVKTIKRNLDLLLKKNWIGYNRKNGYYYIRGFKKVNQIIGGKSKLTAEFDIRDIGKIKNFIAGALISSLIHKQKCRKYLEERKFGRSEHNKKTYFSGYYPVACKAIAKYFGISIGRAFNLKKEASCEKYIHIRHNNERLHISLAELNNYKKHIPEHSGRIFVNRHRVYMRYPDLVLAGIKICSKKIR